MQKSVLIIIWGMISIPTSTDDDFSWKSLFISILRAHAWYVTTSLLPVLRLNRFLSPCQSNSPWTSIFHGNPSSSQFWGPMILLISPKEESSVHHSSWAAPKTTRKSKTLPIRIGLRGTRDCWLGLMQAYLRAYSSDTQQDAQVDELYGWTWKTK